jgi:hypothetical protein
VSFFDYLIADAPGGPDVFTIDFAGRSVEFKMPSSGTELDNLGIEAEKYKELLAAREPSVSEFNARIIYMMAALATTEGLAGQESEFLALERSRGGIFNRAKTEFLQKLTGAVASEIDQLKNESSETLGEESA